jgi:pyruvate-formate lyase-activating enzyme
LVNTITHIKNKIDTNKYNNEKEIEEAIDYVKYEVKKFLETPYTTEDNA